MTRQFFSGASILVVAASILSASPAAASSVCYNINAISVASAGTVCADVDVHDTNGTPVLTAPTPQISTNSASVSGFVAGTGVGATASSSGTFGDAHLYGSSFYTAGPDGANAVGAAYFSFTDLVTVGATNVSAVFTSSLDGAFIDGGSGQSMVRMYDVAGGSDLLNLNIVDSAGFPSHTVTRDVTLLANHSYLFYDAMEGQAVAITNFAHGDLTELADLSNTGLLYIDASGGSLTFLSGHDYSSNAVAGAVPELSTWAMMLLGLAGIGFMAYRRGSEPALISA